MVEPGYAWRPLEALLDPAALSVPELRAFTTLWHRQRERLQGKEAFQRFHERMNRWWSIETGIIERIYDLSEGATLLLIEHGFNASLIAHGESDVEPETLVEILKDHRQALDMVMDVVGGTRSLTVGWIKELHALITRNQETATGRTPDGRRIDVKLLRGEWKRHPNNPMRPDGLVHEYCPPEQVASEMERLVAIYQAMPAEYPEVRAAWLHHEFTRIHPFQDGNGRVARALASVDFIRAGLFPLLVARKEKAKYLKTLETADQGDLKPLVELFAKSMERVLTRAISEAEGAVGELDSMAAVLEAARSKVEARKASAPDAKKVMAKRMEGFAQEARARMEAAAQRISAGVPDVQTTLAQGRLPEGWLENQMIQLANKHDYWVDLREPKRWARLRLADGGITDIVFVFHFVGDPSPGTAIAVIFLDHRDSGERFGTSPLIELGVEPLLLVPEEEETAQRARFGRWLDEALVQALAQWTRFL